VSLESSVFRRSLNAAQNAIIRSFVPVKGCVMTFSDPYSVSLLLLRCQSSTPHTSKVVSYILLNEITAFDRSPQDLFYDTLKNTVLLQFVH